jgi:hypothetical protein
LYGAAAPREHLAVPVADLAARRRERDAPDDVLPRDRAVLVVVEDLQREEPRHEPQEAEHHHERDPRNRLRNSLVSARLTSWLTASPPRPGAGPARWSPRERARRGLKTSGAKSAVEIACGKTRYASARGLAASLPKIAVSTTMSTPSTSPKPNGQRDLGEERLRREPHACRARHDERRDGDEREEPHGRRREHVEQVAEEERERRAARDRVLVHAHEHDERQQQRGRRARQVERPDHPVEQGLRDQQAESETEERRVSHGLPTSSACRAERPWTPSARRRARPSR